MRRVIVEFDRAARVVTKRAETAEEADRLRREARVLDTARHPGITEFLGLHDPPGRPPTLQLRAVAGRTLASEPGGREHRSLGHHEVAGLGAVLATTLADLHDLGMTHGAVSADHIVVDDIGQPVLCSLGRARMPDDVAGPTPADDVGALATTLVGWLPPAPGGAPDDLRRVLARAIRPGRRGVPTARDMAARLSQVPGVALPGAPVIGDNRACDQDGATNPPEVAATPAVQKVPGGARRTWVGAGTVASALAAVALAGFLARPAAQGDPSAIKKGAADLKVAPSCPPVDLGCRPLVHAAGVVTTSTGRYLIGEPDDLVVIGRWRCRVPLPALLQPANGNVWAFDHWPAAGGKLPGRLIAHIDGALSLTVDPAQGGCDRLLVNRRAGPDVGVDLSR